MDLELKDINIDDYISMINIKCLDCLYWCNKCKECCNRWRMCDKTTVPNCFGHYHDCTVCTISPIKGINPPMDICKKLTLHYNEE
jgi:hypothetical protein